MSLLLLLPSEWFALIAMLLLCGHVVTGPCIRTDVRSVCPVGLHVEGVLVICSRGTRVLVSLGKGEALTYPLGRVPTDSEGEDSGNETATIANICGANGTDTELSDHKSDPR
jgi:hypothetical protein